MTKEVHRIRITTSWIDTEDVIYVSVAIIVDTVAGDFTGVPPHVPD